eukprot:93602-Amphidinium_carterae.1
MPGSRPGRLQAAWNALCSAEIFHFRISISKPGARPSIHRGSSSADAQHRTPFVPGLRHTLHNVQRNRLPHNHAISCDEQRKQFRPPMPFKTKQKPKVIRAAVYIKILENEQNGNFLLCDEHAQACDASRKGISTRR